MSSKTINLLNKKHLYTKLLNIAKYDTMVYPVLEYSKSYFILIKDLQNMKKSLMKKIDRNLRIYVYSILIKGK